MLIQRCLTLCSWRQTRRLRDPCDESFHLCDQPGLALMPPRHARPLGLSSTAHFCEFIYWAAQNDRGALPVSHRQQTTMIVLVTCLQDPSLFRVAVDPIENWLRQSGYCFWRVRWHAKSLGLKKFRFDGRKVPIHSRSCALPASKPWLYTFQQRGHEGGLDPSGPSSDANRSSSVHSRTRRVHSPWPGFAGF